LRAFSGYRLWETIPTLRDLNLKAFEQLPDVKSVGMLGEDGKISAVDMVELLIEGL